MKKITIIGGGELGQAIFFLLEKVGTSLQLYDREEEKNRSGKSFAESINGADIVFLAIPSKAVPEAVEEFRGNLKDDAVVVALSKGLIGTDTTEEYLRKNLDGTNTLVLSGPMIAEEILDGHSAYAVVAGGDSESRQMISEIFQGSGLSLEESEDQLGISLCGVLKNIYALSFGMASALSYGENSLGIILERSLLEMLSIVSRLGGKEASVLGPAGVADLAATCYSHNSRNRKSGEAIVGGDKNVGGEGIESLGMMMDKLAGFSEELPLISGINEIVNGNKDAKEVLGKIIF